MPVPPFRPALSDDDVLPVLELSHRGSHSGGGETPVSVSLVMEHFSRAKKVLFHKSEFIFQMHNPGEPLTPVSGWDSACIVQAGFCK